MPPLRHLPTGQLRACRIVQNVNGGYKAWTDAIMVRACERAPISYPATPASNSVQLAHTVKVNQSVQASGDFVNSIVSSNRAYSNHEPMRPRNRARSERNVYSRKSQERQKMCCSLGAHFKLNVHVSCPACCGFYHLFCWPMQTRN